MKNPSLVSLGGSRTTSRNLQSKLKASAWNLLIAKELKGW
jgi:hypothetical protein